MFAHNGLCGTGDASAKAQADSPDNSMDMTQQHVVRLIYRETAQHYCVEATPNAIFGKVGRQASEEVTLQLVRCK